MGSVWVDPRASSRCRLSGACSCCDQWTFGVRSSNLFFRFNYSLLALCLPHFVQIRLS